jgi:hypothetical protein
VNVGVIYARRLWLPKADAGSTLSRSFGRGEAESSDKFRTNGDVAVTDSGGVEDSKPLRNTDHLILRGHHCKIDGLEESDFQGVQFAQGDPCNLGHVVIANEEIAVAFMPTMMLVASRRCAVSGVGTRPVAWVKRPRSARPIWMPNAP